MTKRLNGPIMPLSDQNMSSHRLRSDHAVTTSLHDLGCNQLWFCCRKLEVVNKHFNIVLCSTLEADQDTLVK